MPGPYTEYIFVVQHVNYDELTWIFNTDSSYIFDYYAHPFKLTRYIRTLNCQNCETEVIIQTARASL